MKWIKASERLPEHRKQVCAKFGGEYYRIRNVGDDLYFGSTDIRITEQHDKIEWLDEFKGENEAIAQVDYWKKRFEDKKIQLAECIAILSGILKDPYGCPMCDSGKLRNLERQHWPECLFYQAENLLYNVGVRFVGQKKDELDKDNPYWCWPQCDVEGCERVSCYGGTCWPETGYWSVCPEHSQMHRNGEPQPKMKDEAIEREKSRLPDGTLPVPQV